MLAKRIIPCLDIAHRRVVKGHQFGGLVDQGDPVDLAASYAEAGADELVFLDIEATVEGRATLIDLVTQLARRVFIPLTVGGGVRTTQDIRDLLRAGADKVSIQTAAVGNPSLVSSAASSFGSQCVVVAIDTRRREQGWEVYTHGARRATGLDAVAWAAKLCRLGAGELLVTSVDADGTNAGYDLALTAAISDSVSIPVIASGGAGGPQDLVAVLTEGRADAALAASIFHSGRWTVAAIKDELRAAGVAVRG
ncbi:MAG TPA: imidazole glycerol phosphate synthase subunit HisF [Candidatus Dormibacteraeota bacterium]|nr:imidazole glycerol phosphate synthase subunit HisF [Candidatus Dormibacteraeota bacterium]